MANEHLANNDINNLQVILDLITDEYGNYYEVSGVTHKDGKLTKITLSHIYYEIAFSRIFEGEEIEKYKHKHIGAFLLDLVNSSIEQSKKKNRTIFTIRDLIENGTEVEFLNQTTIHPRAQ